MSQKTVKPYKEMILCRPSGYSQGIAHVECTRCQTQYPITNSGRLMCNNEIHYDCPYCRPEYDQEQAKEWEGLREQAIF